MWHAFGTLSLGIVPALVLAISFGLVEQSCAFHAWQLPLATSRDYAVTFHRLRPPEASCRIVLRSMADDAAPEDGSPGKPNFNVTTDWEKDLGMELLRAKRPKGIDDFVEGIPQAPGTETVFKGARGDDPVYPAYTSDATQDFVGSKIGLEKRSADYSDGLFADRRREPASGREQVRQVEADFVNVFSQERNFIGGLIGILFLGIFYVSVWNGGGVDVPRYGADGSAAVPAGKVIERYEEAFVCYGIPSANDPNGCRVKSSVGPVRVFSRAPGPAAQENAGIDGAAGADEAVVETDE